MTALQRRQLRQLQSLESISSFHHFNLSECRLLYDDFTARKNLLVQQAMEFPATIGSAPLKWNFTQHEPVRDGMDFWADIPGKTWQMPNPPGFFLPQEMRLGRNMRQVREYKLRRRREIEMAEQADPSGSSAAADAVASSKTSSSCVSSLSAQSAPLMHLTLSEWCLDKLLAHELQSSMEAARVLNASDEGSYLSVIRTDGDGNCLCHAVMMAIYGYPDFSGTLRDALYWELNSDAHRPAYLDRYMHEQAREIGSAGGSTESTSAPTTAAARDPNQPAMAAALDEADKQNLEKEFAQAIERLCNPKKYLDAIHVVSHQHTHSDSDTHARTVRHSAAHPSLVAVSVIISR